MMKPSRRPTIAAAAVVAALTAMTLSASAGSLAYIPLGGDDKIIVVDMEKNTVIGEITGVADVHGLAVTPDNRHLIAGSNDERSATAAVAPQKPKGVSANEHAAHHGKSKGKSAKASDTVSTLSIIRIADRSIVRRIDVPGAVHHVAVSPNGRLAVVTHSTGDGISVINLETFAVAATIATGPTPNYAVFSPDSSLAFVSNAGNDTVSEVDVGKNIVRRNFVVGSMPEHVVLSRDGSRLFVNNTEGGTVSVVDIERGETVKSYPVGTALHGIDLSDDDRTLFVAVLGDDKITAIDLMTGTYRSNVLSPEPYHLAAIKGTGKLYVSSAEQPKAWVIDQATLKVIGEIPIGGKGHQLVQVNKQ